jgi:hypothetical protein
MEIRKGMRVLFRADSLFGEREEWGRVVEATELGNYKVRYWIIFPIFPEYIWVNKDEIIDYEIK